MEEEACIECQRSLGFQHSGRGGAAIRIVVCRIVDLDCGDPDCDKLRRSGLPYLIALSRYDDPDCRILIDQVIFQFPEAPSATRKWRSGLSQFDIRVKIRRSGLSYLDYLDCGNIWSHFHRRRTKNWLPAQLHQKVQL